MISFPSSTRSRRFLQHWALELFWALLVVPGIGCSIREGLPREVRPWPPVLPEGTEKLSIGLAVVSTRNKEVLKDPWPGNQLGEKISNRIQGNAKWCRGVKALYEASGLFRDVCVDGRQTNLTAELEFVRGLTTWSDSLAILWGCTLGCTPVWWQEDLTLKTTFKDPRGAVIGVAERYVRTVTWFWFPLSIVLAWGPTNVDPDPELSGTMEDLLRTTLLDAHEGGYLHR